ncbi:hypothetical protein Tco_0440686, partial [Tanacetum coccineum]
MVRETLSHADAESGGLAPSPVPATTYILQSFLKVLQLDQLSKTPQLLKLTFIPQLTL